MDAGADVNKQSTTGATALHTATKQGHTELVKLLINAATDVNMVSGFRRTDTCRPYMFFMFHRKCITLTQLLAANLYQELKG